MEVRGKMDTCKKVKNHESEKHWISQHLKKKTMGQCLQNLRKSCSQPGILYLANLLIECDMKYARSQEIYLPKTFSGS